MAAYAAAGSSQICSAAGLVKLRRYIFAAIKFFFMVEGEQPASIAGDNSRLHQHRQQVLLHMWHRCAAAASQAHPP
jgi:hypothetical protein